MPRTCEWCSGPLPARARRDAITCSQSCRQARHRVAAAVRDGSARSRRDVSRVDQALQARRLAYADPPYPGKSFYYRGHPDYAGEVDHGELIRRLSTYDGWALSTSARALPNVLSLAVAQGLGVRVAAWVRGARPHATAHHALNAWEPVIYVPVPSRVNQPLQARRVDVLTHGVAPMTTLPGRVIGAKPAAFCRWMFDLIGASPRDTLDDLFPGSGIVGQAWRAYVSPAPANANDSARLTAVGDADRVHRGGELLAGRRDGRGSGVRVIEHHEHLTQHALARQPRGRLAVDGALIDPQADHEHAHRRHDREDDDDDP